MENYRDELYHHGIMGMKWGVRNEETRAKYQGGMGTRRNAAPNVKYKKVKRANQGGVINGKEYRKSWTTARAEKKASKALVKSVENPNSANVLGSMTWKNKAEYHKMRDIGRTGKTRAATIGGNVAAAGATATGALMTAALLGGTAAALPYVAISAATVAAGRTIAKQAMKREYRSGRDISSGKKTAIPKS